MRAAAALLVLAGCDQLFGISHYNPADAANDPNAVVSVSAGGFDSCALLASGDVWCWGLSAGGQLGNGATTMHDTPTPTHVLAPAGIIAIDTADAGTCGLRDDSEVVCWGPSSDVLGVAPTGPTLVPTGIAGPAGVEQVAVGYALSCIRHGGHVACAGEAGLLGDGTMINRASYADIPGISTAIDITTGDKFGCALLSAGAVVCWGANEAGQLGNQQTSATPEPAAVVGPLGPYVQITAGDTFACGLTLDGDVDCWGDGSAGQLGDPIGTNRPSAQRVLGITGAKQIVGAAYSACALVGDGMASCWGSNQSGELGDGLTELTSTTPKVVSSLHRVKQITARTGGHVCALTELGEVWCWGANQFGQLGQDASAIPKSGSPLAIRVPPS